MIKVLVCNKCKKHYEVTEDIVTKTLYGKRKNLCNDCYDSLSDLFSITPILSKVFNGSKIYKGEK